MTGRTYYRCSGCGVVAAPHQIGPDDDSEPIVTCRCWKGPNWIRGVWQPINATIQEAHP